MHCACCSPSPSSRCEGDQGSEEEEESKYKATKSLLTILCQVLSKGVVDFADAPSNPVTVAVVIGDVVSFGTQLVSTALVRLSVNGHAFDRACMSRCVVHVWVQIFPAVTTDLLNRPKLCSKYMDVVSGLVTGYPEKVRPPASGVSKLCLSSKRLAVSASCA